MFWFSSSSFKLLSVQVWSWHLGFWPWGNITDYFFSHSLNSEGLIAHLNQLSLKIWIYRVENAEVLCLGIVSVAVFMLVLPLFKATGSILLQIAPSNIHPSAFNKCSRQVNLPMTKYCKCILKLGIWNFYYTLKNLQLSLLVFQSINSELGTRSWKIKILLYYFASKLLSPITFGYL